MKRLQLIILFTALSTASVFAQYNRYENRGGERYQPDSDRQEFRSFERALDQFSFALVTNNLRAARYAKFQIMLDMEREIEQTRRALRAENIELGFGNYSKREPDWRTPRMHSRRNGTRQRSNNRGYAQRDIAELVHRLEKQERLYYRFSELRLERNRRGIVNENEHRRLMYSFQDTMREELLDDRTERERVRRGR
jgi:hypothetical protein